ncbi:unnamed protein product [Microthlaspi erraticum]|uniref:Neprosin PEP catalytic domain-containing protein n=1 Tax=Microthlaspi erraticum TaxID=1685480 RepID=A0A6D2L7L6_9BRAS|nr:unnamed protein product [Microthlaspi erraticum]
MGSGHFADEGFGKASYFRNLEIVVNNNTFEPVQEVDVVEVAPDYKFYNIKKMFRDDWGTYLFYGGPEFDRMHSGVAFLVLSSVSFYLSVIFFFLII